MGEGYGIKLGLTLESSSYLGIIPVIGCLILGGLTSDISPNETAGLGFYLIVWVFASILIGD